MLRASGRRVGLRNRPAVDLLILDEPTIKVDALSRRQFCEPIVLIRARRTIMSVVVATAYMGEAESFDWLVAIDCWQSARDPQCR